MSSSKLRENIVALSCLQALNYVAPLITVPYLLRVLGPAHYGLIAFAQALVVYFDAVTGWGFNLSATRAVACSRHRPDVLSAVFWRTMYARTALMLASAAVLAALVTAVPRLRATPWLYAAAFLTVVGTAVCPVWFFQGLEQMRVLTLAQAATRVLSIPALLLFVGGTGDYLRAATIQGAVPVLTGVLVAPAVWIRIRSGPPRPRLTHIVGALRGSWHLFVTQMGFVLSTATTAVVLGFIAGSTAVGYYTAADKIIRAVSSLLGPVAQALYPHLNHLKEQSLDQMLRIMRKSFVWIAGLAVCASVGTLLLASPVGPLIWGRGFTPSIAVLRWLSPLPLVYALINILGTQTLLVFEMDALVSRIVLAGAGVNVPLAAVLSWRFGAPGAAAATVSTGLLISFCLAWNARRAVAVWRERSRAVCAS